MEVLVIQVIPLIQNVQIHIVDTADIHKEMEMPIVFQSEKEKQEP